MSLGIEVWAAVELRYAPKESDLENDAKLDFVANAKAMNALLSGLCAEKIYQSNAQQDCQRNMGYSRKHP